MQMQKDKKYYEKRFELIKTMFFEGKDEGLRIGTKIIKNMIEEYEQFSDHDRSLIENIKTVCNIINNPIYKL
jgi:hypothetical protein